MCCSSKTAWSVPLVKYLVMYLMLVMLEQISTLCGSWIGEGGMGCRLPPTGCWPLAFPNGASWSLQCDHHPLVWDADTWGSCHFLALCSLKMALGNVWYICGPSCKDCSGGEVHRSCGSYGPSPSCAALSLSPYQESQRRSPGQCHQAWPCYHEQATRGYVYEGDHASGTQWCTGRLASFQKFTVSGAPWAFCASDRRHRLWHLGGLGVSCPGSRFSRISDHLGFVVMVMKKSGFPKRRT